MAHQHRDEQVFRVRVDPDLRGNVFHDRLPFVAALAPPGANPRHYNLTMASRSFHIV